MPTVQEFEVEVTIKGTFTLRLAIDTDQTTAIEKRAQELVNEAASTLQSRLLTDWQVTRITPIE
jgi:uncharacterized protein YmfQ (DUF2313 family)